MEELGKHLKQNNFPALKKALAEMDDEAAIQGILVVLAEDYGVITAIIVEDIAREKNRVFWWVMSGWLWSFNFSYIDGAEQSALFMFRQGLDLDTDDEEVLKALLDFYGPPQVLLTKEEALDYAKRILILDPAYERAQTVVAENE